jgi:predicted nucleic acid-binding protein
MTDYLLDTNILIGLIDQDEWTQMYVERFDAATLAISVISYMEVLMGTKPEQRHEVKKFLDNFQIIELDRFMAEKVVELLLAKKIKNLKYSKLPDMIIAQTALRMAVPLITYNKADFKGIKGLQVLAP